MAAAASAAAAAVSTSSRKSVAIAMMALIRGNLAAQSNPGLEPQ